MSSQATKGTKPTNKDTNTSGRDPFTPGPTIYSKSDGGRYERTPLQNSTVAGECEKGSGKDGN
jgi:hypothetical protein